MDNIVLNKKQKKFLFNNAYVDSKTFDAAVYRNSEKYFINNFTWYLSARPVLGPFRRLILRSPESSEISYMTGLNIIYTDFNTLITL